MRATISTACATLLTLAMLIFSSAVLDAATATWTNGNSTNITSDPLNWDVAPATGDDLVFGSGADAISVDAALSAGSITLNGTFAGTITQNASVSATSLTMTTGTWDSASYGLAISGDFSVSAAGLYDAGSGTVTITGSVSIDTDSYFVKTFEKGTSTVVLSGTSNLDVYGFNNRFYGLNMAATSQTTTLLSSVDAQYVTIGAGTLDGNEQNLWAGGVAESGKILTVDSSASIVDLKRLYLKGDSANGSVTADGVDLSNAGTWSGELIFWSQRPITMVTRNTVCNRVDMFKDGTWNLGDLDLTVNGTFNVGFSTGAVTVNCGSGTITCNSFYLESNGGAPHVNFDSATVNCSGNFTVDADTTSHAGSATIDIGGDFVLRGGSMDADTSTITIAGDIFIDAADYFDLTFDRGTSTVTKTGSGDIDTYGFNNRFQNLFIAQNTADTVTISTGTLKAEYLTVGSGTVNAQSLSIEVGDHALTGKVLTAAADATFIDVNRFYLSGRDVAASVTADGIDISNSVSDGQIQFWSKGTVQMVSRASTCKRVDMFKNGTWDLNDFDLTVTGDLNIGFNTDSPTLKAGAGTITANKIYLEATTGTATLDMESATMNAANNVTADDTTILIPGTSTLVMTDTGTINVGGKAIHNLEINTANSVSVTGDLVVNGDITVTAGTFTGAAESKVELAGSTTQAVDLNGQSVHALAVSNATAAISITGDMNTTGTFSIVPGASVIFTAGKTITTRMIDWQGTAGNLINLSSSSPANAWLLNTHEYAVDYVSVSDSNASGSNAPILASNSTDGTGNTNWIFGPSSIMITTGTSSYTSPAWVEGVTSAGISSLTVSVDSGTAFDASILSTNQFYADNAGSTELLGINLSSTATTNVQIDGTDGLNNYSDDVDITWTPIDLTAYTPNSVTIRRGDKLLLTGNGPGTTMEIDSDGDGTFEFSGVPGDKFEVTYATAGDYTAQVKIDGIVVGQDLNATVVGINHFSESVAVELGFTRDIDITVVNDADVSDVTVDGFGGAFVGTTIAAGQTYNLIAELTVWERGAPMLLARLNEGPAFLAKEVDEFTIENKASIGATFNKENGLGGTTIMMRPYVPNVEFEFDMFAHQATFLGGALDFTVDTSGATSSLGETGFTTSVDPETGETIGSFYYTLELPAGEDKYCYSIDASQEGSERKKIKGTSSNNGSACYATVSELCLCAGGNTGIITIVIESPKDLGPCGVVVEGFPANDGMAPMFTALEGLGLIECKPPVPRTYYFEVISGSDGGVYDVLICGVPFEDRITVLQVTHETKCIAPGDPNKHRLMVGVCEEVILCSTPGPATWSATCGTLGVPAANCITWTAPNSAGTCTVTATYDECSCSVTFEIIEPNSIDMVDEVDISNAVLWPDQQGAFMSAKFKVGPDHVSFCNIQIRELSGAAETAAPNQPTGDWSPGGLLDPYGPPDHDATGATPPNIANNPEGPWLAINQDNKGDGFDTAGHGVPDLLRGHYFDGCYTWLIPIEWKCESDATASGDIGELKQVHCFSFPKDASVDKGSKQVTHTAQ